MAQQIWSSLNKKYKKLVSDESIDGLNYDTSNEIAFCKPCGEGKHHKFPKKGGKRTQDLSELVQSDVCGKIGAKSINAFEYFLTLIDDKSRYTWSKVFKTFTDWKTMQEKATGLKIKCLQSDNEIL